MQDRFLHMMYSHAAGRAAMQPLVQPFVSRAAGCFLDSRLSVLVLAGLLEVGWAIGLKSSHGFTRFWPSVATLVLMALSFFLLASALKHLPIGTAYAVWTGIGAVGTALLGIVLFGESASPARLLCIGLILAGIAGLKLLSDA